MTTVGGLMTSQQVTLVEPYQDIDQLAPELNQFGNATAPNGSFGGFAAPSVVTNGNGSVDLVLQFNYAQSTALAAGFLVFFNVTGAANSITDPAYLIDARPGAASYTIRIQGVETTARYSYAVAAFFPTSGGRAISSLQTPASWQNFQPGSADNYTGNIAGTSATVVKDGAANGQTAFTQTAQYRGNLPPSNAPGGFGQTWNVFTNQTSVTRFNFSYSQGENVATHFAFYLKYGGGTIVAGDPHFLVSAGAGTSVQMPFATPHRGTWRFGVAAVAMCRDGPQFNSTIVQSDDIVLSNSDHVGTTTRTYYVDGAPLVLGDGSGSIQAYNSIYVHSLVDFAANDAKLIPRVFNYGSGSPPVGGPFMLAGEEASMICTVAAIGYYYKVYFDGVNKFYSGVNMSNGAYAGGVNLF